jgi:acyl-coenzyme A synthetase/AMP-(fatty) acid ligase
MAVNSLWECVVEQGAAPAGLFHGRNASVDLAELSRGSLFGGRLAELKGRSVLIATREQLASAVALLELDGIARRVVLCTPDLSSERLDGVAQTAAADAVVLDASETSATPSAPALARYVLSSRPAPANVERHASAVTEWILLTSGTTGAPKLVVHTLQSLAGTLPAHSPGTRTVWSTFYDIRRYGGLQIYLRAVRGGSPLVLSSSDESTRDFIARATAAGVTHITGTPSHWRRALMSGDAAMLAPEYVRLSGEVADQALLDSLRAAFPKARIVHAFASTEAGVAFEVDDGIAGFPAEFIGSGRGQIDLKVEDGTLRIRSGRNATRYLGDASTALTSGDGFVDTGDMVELVDGRYYFRGRRGGVINVGGFKVYPEEIESVLNADPRVRMSLVRARRNPITGAVVVADVVLKESAAELDAAAADSVKRDLLNACRASLAAHKVPAMLRFVPALELTAGGKLVRPDA